MMRDLWGKVMAEHGICNEEALRVEGQPGAHQELPAGLRPAAVVLHAHAVPILP